MSEPSDGRGRRRICRRWAVPGRVGCVAVAATVVLFPLTLVAAAAAAPRPLPNAHAHNDYLHAHPLADALSHGFCSVEADIFLVDGQLLVGHTRADLKPARTLQALYLEPLRQRVRQQGGRVYRNGPPCTLLIDVKTAAAPTYAALREVLAEYADILTSVRNDVVETRAVTAVISGNRAEQAIAADSPRYAAIDGRLADLDSDKPVHLLPWISENWQSQFKWRGEGAFPAEQQTKLRAMVAKAHQQRRRLRFWATADRPEVWRELLAAGVDLISADDLAGLAKFLAK